MSVTAVWRTATALEELEREKAEKLAQRAAEHDRELHATARATVTPGRR